MSPQEKAIQAIGACLFLILVFSFHPGVRKEIRELRQSYADFWDTPSGQLLRGTYDPDLGRSGFTIRINDIDYRSSRTLSPGSPLMALFTHPDADVTQVRMQHPKNPRLYRVFQMNREVHIKNHEDMMDKGLLSASDFIAVDRSGNHRGRIRLIFKPRKWQQLKRELFGK